jgi:hypothetical protein
MRMISRWVALAVLVLAGGCSKPLALEPSATGAGSPALEVARTLNETGSSRPFKVQLKIVGSIVTLEPDFQPRLHRNQAFYVAEPGAVPLDTVPAYGVLEKVYWRPIIGARASDMDEPTGSAENANGPNANPMPRVGGETFAPGMHQLTLQAPGHAGGGEATVRFWVGFIPATWWAGPDPDRWPVSSDGDGRAVDVIDWNTFTTVPAWPPDGRSYFGPDSLRHIPSARRPPGDDFERRTFYEIHGDRIYARREGDTVHQNSWVVLINGGYDKDSPYVPRVHPADPALPPDFAANPGLYPVLQSLGLVGSPIGFRTQLTMKLPDGTVFRASASGLYPVFDPLSVFRLPVIAGYVRAALPGKAYVVARAQDSDGLLDAAVTDPIGIIELVDAGGGTPAERLARRKVITFLVAPATGSE